MSLQLSLTWRLIILAGAFLCGSLQASGLMPVFFSFNGGVLMGVFIATADWQRTIENWRKFFNK